MSWPDQDGPLAYLQSTEEVLRPEQSETGFPPSEVLELFGEIELKSQSKSPVSQAVASSWTTAWHPYHSRTRINATSAGLRISWLRPSSINRARTRTRPGSIRGRPSPFPPKRQHRQILAGMDAPFCFGEYQYALPFFGASSVLSAFSIIPSPLQAWETPSLFSCFSVPGALVGCS
jgi:hypothetical protein